MHTWGGKSRPTTPKNLSTRETEQEMERNKTLYVTSLFKDDCNSLFNNRNTFHNVSPSISCLPRNAERLASEIATGCYVSRAAFAWNGQKVQMLKDSISTTSADLWVNPSKSKCGKMVTIPTKHTYVQRRQSRIPFVKIETNHRCIEPASHHLVCSNADLKRVRNLHLRTSFTKEIR